MLKRTIRIAALLLFAASSLLYAQTKVTSADYEQAMDLQGKYSKLAINIPDTPEWQPKTDTLIYRKTVEGGHEFMMVDAATLTKKPAFDHARLAAALSTASGKSYTAVTLPFPRFGFVDQQSAIRFALDHVEWQCDLKAYVCKKEKELPVINAEFHGYNYDDTPKEGNSLEKTVASPDGQWLAYIDNYNVFVRSKDGKQKFPLSWDGSEGNYYALSTVGWSPDSKHLVAYRIRPGYNRVIHYIESSPADQLQPEYPSLFYPKAGDVLPLPQPVLFQIATKREIQIDNTLFPNPFDLRRPEWWKDSRGFTFEYNQRGHQVYRVIEVNAETGKAQTLINETSKTFIDYSPLSANQFDNGSHYRYDVNDGQEIIWGSQRDGWEHLYLFNGKTGALENQITKGDWVVRAVNRVDPKTRQIWFEASGVNAGEDPYFVHAYRINFDGTGLTALTPIEANHNVEYSPDGKYYVDTWSRVDLPPTMALYRTSDNKQLMVVEKGDISKLIAAGWKPPMVFKAKGRDGKTEIWGLIYKPANFDPHKKYPVIEDIYAGPQGSFVPKSFSTRIEPLTQLGFVVARIDGMGTNNRSRAFHDVAWKNLKDAGFPDRILWHKAAAAEFPWYDISNVGIFGTSAGGQSAVAALLFHPDFYKVAVANSGCYDNRMDKIWWNEQWMGWPVGPQYSESSDVDNAWRLKGKLMIVVGEMDPNVDPASAFQLIDRLIKAKKYFDMLYVPGGSHGAGGSYGQLKLMDFFVHNIMGQTPPNWNAEPLKLSPEK